MNKFTYSLVFGCALVLSSVNQVQAHVSYFDLSAGLFTDSAGHSWDDEQFSSNSGWYDGTQATLGDSHGLAGGTFFKFELTQASYVNLTFADTSGQNDLNPAFSLYAGLLPDGAHDDTKSDPLNPSHFVIGSGTVKDASIADNGISSDANGNVSPLRDTANLTYTGQFNALGDWSMANANADNFCTSQPAGACNATSLAAAAAAGDWSVIKYITHVDPTGGTLVSLNNYWLPAGTYTIAAGGGNAVNTDNDLNGTITYWSTAATATVPLPATVWTFLTAIFGLLGIARRKKKF